MQSNVQCRNDLLERMRFNRFPVFLLLVLSSFFLFRCSRGPVEPEFGASYQVVIHDIAGAPESPPRLAGEWLLLKVSYDGGCVDHAFTLERVIRQDTAHIWLKHSIPNDETCTDTMTEDISIQIPEGARNHKTIALHLPPGGPPYMLRWR